MSTQADGSIIVDVDVDEKKAQQELNRLNKKIETINDNIYKKQQEKMPLVEQAQKLGAELDAVKAKLDRMQSGDEFFTNTQIKEQTNTVSQLQKEWDGVNKKIDTADSYINRQNIDLELTEGKIGEIEGELAKINSGSETWSKITGEIDKRMNMLGKRISNLAKRVFVFTLITSALRGMKDYMSKVIKTNGEATAAIAKLKGAFLTLAQPLVNVIIPAFTAFVNVLARVVSAAASLVSSLFGTTAKESAAAAESLYNQTEAIESTGNAAKKAEKQLASFDEINKLSSNHENESGGSNNTEISPDFSVLDLVNEKVDAIAKGAMLAGAGFALWKIAEYLPGRLGEILSKLGLIIIAVGSLIVYWGGLKDAWENGVDWDNMAMMIGGAAAAATALYLAFGNIGAGIALVVTGIGMLVAGFNDVIKNGANLENTLLIIGGIITAGLGIALLAGSWIPAAVAGIAALVYALVSFGGEADALVYNIKEIFGGLIDFITGVFTGNWEQAWEGVKRVFKGLWNSILAIFGGVINAIVKGLNWVITKLNTLSWTVPDWVPGIGGETWGFNISPIPEWDVPYLATGAVIPPNREFMAVLGDQKSGTNIETPLSTMIQAFKTALSEGGYGGNSTIIMEVDGQQFAKVVYNANKRETKRVGVSLAEV